MIVNLREFLDKQLVDRLHVEQLVKGIVEELTRRHGGPPGELCRKMLVMYARTLQCAETLREGEARSHVLTRARTGLEYAYQIAEFESELRTEPGQSVTEAEFFAGIARLTGNRA